MVGCHDTHSTDNPPTTTPFNRSASLQEQLSRALQAKFLLLYQPAPNAFVVLDPSSQSVCQWEMSTSAQSARKHQRFKVTLGGHSSGCTCSENPFGCPASTHSPCAHTLFILLRVLRLRLDDPRIARPRLENYEVEPLLQHYARLKASNFHQPAVLRPQPEVVSGCSVVSSPVARIVMPRPVALHDVPGTSAALLVAIQASLGSSSECSELSSITRSIEPASRTGHEGHALSVCRRCLSHVSACGAGLSNSCVGEGEGECVSDGVGGAEVGAFADHRRPKTEPQSYCETSGSRVGRSHPTPTRYVLPTTFRPIWEPSSNPETDPETEGISSSSQSSRFDEFRPQGGPRVATLDSSGGPGATGDTLVSLPRQSMSPEVGLQPPVNSSCGLCLRDLHDADAHVAICSSTDCAAKFHQDCFDIWQQECESETGSLFCSVCGRIWTMALTPTNAPDGGKKLPVSSESVVTPATTTTTTTTGVDSALLSSATSKLPTSIVNTFCEQNQIISGLKDGLAVWKSAFSEEVAMGIISPYWHVRQSALRQVAKITICRVLMARKSPHSSIPQHTNHLDVPPQPPPPPPPATTTHSTNLGPEYLRMSFRLIQYLLSDPADEVFIASLCAFREILGYLICLDAETMFALQQVIGPVLRRLLVFVGGYIGPGCVPINNIPNHNQPYVSGATEAPVASPDQRRRANLALATLVELAKGQGGEMSIGRDTSNADECMSISGLPHLANFLLRSAKFHPIHLVGRLKLLEKLVEMHREMIVPSGEVDAKRCISYRHLCSSLIFARRHVYPPEQPMFPHNYMSEEAASSRFGVGGIRNPAEIVGRATPLKVSNGNANVPDVHVSSFSYLMKANIKASRLARRVFIAVARALLLEPRLNSPTEGANPSLTSLPSAKNFVTAEIALLDVTLAAKLRTKLSDLLDVSDESSKIVPTALHMNHEPPPLPPPRRFSKAKSKPQEIKNPTPGNSTATATATTIINPIAVRVALEPAYDHVAISETAPYSSEDDEEEGVEEEPLEKLNWEEVGTAQQREFKQETPALTSPVPPCLPVVPTPAELSALKTALRRAAWFPVPLVPIPNLTQSLNPKEPLKSVYKYREGVDWLLGPFLGKGAFSQCYQARDIRTGTLMAVKRLRFMGDDSSTESMEQLATATEEVAIMRRLCHPNILRLFGISYNPEKRHVDIFVEWMPGGSITSLLNQYGAFTEPVSLAYILQVIRGIHCLHKHGILHRDLKGANLLVNTSGSVVRISDFGASARLGSQGSIAGQFQGQVIGTFAFMAPEVLRGEAYGRACDIWSVGCCLLEMLSGKPPWNDSRLTNQYALMFTIASAEQPPSYPTHITAPVKKFLDSCFNRIPEQRPNARRLLQHPVFSSIISAPETTSPSTPSSSSACSTTAATVSTAAAVVVADESLPGSGLSKSFTAISLTGGQSTRAVSRHRALPPVPCELRPPPLRPSLVIAELSGNYDKLAVTVTSSRSQTTANHHIGQLQQQAVSQTKICRNQ